jgi:hypothetical protein
MEDTLLYRCQSPVLLLWFNRPQHAAAVLARLRLVAPARVYIHIDGPRPNRDGEAVDVAATQRLIQQIDWNCEVKLLIRRENWGLRAAVNDAINWFFSQEQAGIILEDDCLAHPSFFQFCDEMLAKYAHHEEIMHVAGSNNIAHLSANWPSDYVFSHYPLVWGWATWARAWKRMDIDLKTLPEWEERGGIRQLDKHILVQAYLLDKFMVTRAKTNHSWAYAWFFSILYQNGLCIVPKVNMIENTGLGDPAATNTKNAAIWVHLPAQPSQFPLTHPTEIQVAKTIDRQLFYHTQKSRWRLPIWWLRHWVRRIFDI